MHQLPDKQVQSVKRILSVVPIAALVLGLSACDIGGEGDVETDTSDITPADGGAENDSGADAEIEYKNALVVATDYTTGSYATISLDDHSATKDINFVHSDVACRFDTLTRTPFLLLRLGADAIDVLNPDTFEIDKEYSVGPSMNPHDIAVVAEDRAYISRFASAEMLVVHPTTGEEIGTVDLSEYADDDGIPEVSGMYVIDGKVYALVQRVDRANDWAPTDQSFMLVIDGPTGAVEEAIELTGINPVGPPIYSAALDRLVISEPGSYGTIDDGGIELFNPAVNTLSGFVVTEQELGGSVSDGVIVSETKGYAIVGVAGDNGSNTHVVSFNPKTGEKTATLLEGGGWVYGSIALSPDGTELWVADQTMAASGIRIFNTADDSEKTAEPIDVGLPPSKICFTS